MKLQDLYNNYESSDSFFEGNNKKTEEVVKPVIPPKVIEKPKTEVKKQEVKEEKKEELDDELIEKLFIESETKLEFKEKWINTYKKGFKNNKDNYIARKIRAGRFRIDPTQKRGIAFLPDLKTKDMDAKQLLNTQWLRRI